MVNIAKSVVTLNSGVVGCAISPKHVITPKDTLRWSWRRRPAPASFDGYTTVHEIDESPFAILEAKMDLTESLGIPNGSFPRFSDLLPTLGEMLAVVKEGPLLHPLPRFDYYGASDELASGELSGAIILAAPCSFIIDRKDASPKLLITTPRTNLPSGTPVFDSSGYLRGLVFVGLNNSRLDTSGDREESSIFHVLPLISADVRNLSLKNDLRFQ
jgi:hypothetical protein